MGKKSKKQDLKKILQQQTANSSATGASATDTSATDTSATDTSATIKLTFWHKFLPPMILSLITTVFYNASLKYPFQFDDLANITKKFDIRFSDPLSQWWKNRRWMGEWLNRMNFDIGRFEPFYYRLTNLILHISIGILVFFLVLEGCAYLKKQPFFAKHALAIATATAALFMLHPVQTQAVSYVIQARLEGLATLFVLTTLLLMLKAFQVKSNVLKYMLLALSLVVGFLSCGTKEIAIVSPLLAVLVDWFFLAEGDWASFKSRLWFHALFSFVIFATFVHYLSPKFISDAVQLKIVSGNNKGNILTEHAHDIIKSSHYFISSFKVILHYLLMFLWPAVISVEYDWKLSDGFFAPDAFFPFIILAALVSLAIYSFLKKRYSFFGFGFLWFLVCVAPRSSIIPSPELICDYKTYLPSIGWLFVLATVFVAITSFFMKKLKTIPMITYSLIPQIAVIILFAMPLGYAAMSRNTVWSSSVEFWKDISKKAPNKARGHNNLGVALSEAGKFEEAIPCYLEAIRLDRHYSDPWSNLAVAYSVKNETNRAISALKQAIKICPNYPEAYNNLGTLMIKKKNYEAAEKILRIAVKIRPHYGKAYFNLGRLYMDQKKPDLAWQHFKKATEGDLDTTEGFYTLGQISLKMKKYDKAAEAFQASLNRSNPSNIKHRNQISFNLANAYFMDKKLKKALPIFERLCKEEPTDHRYLYNLAETLYSKKEFVKAGKIFGRLASVPFGLAQANFRYANCLEKENRLDDARKALILLMQAKQIPEKMKTMVRREIGRIAIQQKINKGNCTLTMKDLRKAFSADLTTTT